jgi:hypothetical protein
MYKCDFCHDLIKTGGIPACVAACEKRLGAERPLLFGNREDILEAARMRAKEIGGFIYGEKENGGTATLYVSKIPYEDISVKLLQNKSTLHMLSFRNRLDNINPWAAGFVAGPAIFAAGAVILALRRRKKTDKEGR